MVERGPSFNASLVFGAQIVNNVNVGTSFQKVGAIICIIFDLHWYRGESN